METKCGRNKCKERRLVHMYEKRDSISCMMELTEILKNEPNKAKEYIENNIYRMSKEDISNILIEVLRGLEVGCYHPQFEKIMTDIQIELDEHYDEQYQEYQRNIDEVNACALRNGENYEQKRN